MSSWLQIREEDDMPEVNDYGIIFRHTEKRAGRHQTWITLAGYTEHATAISAHYLAANWKDLWTKYVQNQPAESLGDFLVIIEGPSAPDPDRSAAHWSEALAVTPQKLHDLGIESVWQQRLHNRPLSAR